MLPLSLKLRTHLHLHLHLQPPAPAPAPALALAHTRSPADLSARASLLSLITRLLPSSPSLTRWVDLRSSSCTDGGRVAGSTLTHDRFRALRIWVAGRASGEVGGIYLPGAELACVQAVRRGERGAEMR